NIRNLLHVFYTFNTLLQLRTLSYISFHLKLLARLLSLEDAQDKLENWRRNKIMRERIHY
ncbi:hypothetical protein AZZ73_004647, partial [Klebsiella pneumoniae]